MTDKENERPSLKPRPIDRKKIYAWLVVAAVLAIVAANDSDGEMSEEEANEPINAVFYQNTAQCEADMTKQQEEYAVLLKKYKETPTAPQQDPPLSPPMQPQDCANQMLAAQEEHQKTAPIYPAIAECQAEGVQCESLPPGGEAGYRPIYGGTYIDPYYQSSHSFVGYGGTVHQVYETRPVYQSITPGNVVTPYGREISQTTTGRVTAPRHTSFAAPSRPTGTSASGTIRGRSSQGFGSSFKSSGSGGK